MNCCLLPSCLRHGLVSRCSSIPSYQRLSTYFVPTFGNIPPNHVSPQIHARSLTMPLKGFGTCLQKRRSSVSVTQTGKQAHRDSYPRPSCIRSTQARQYVHPLSFYFLFCNITTPLPTTKKVKSCRERVQSVTAVKHATNGNS